MLLHKLASTSKAVQSAIFNRQLNVDHSTTSLDNKSGRTYTSQLGQRSPGPYNVIQVHTNGTLTIKLRPGVTPVQLKSRRFSRKGRMLPSGNSIMDLGLLHSAILDYSEAARLN